MTSKNSIATREYKDICAGIGCRNRPTVSLIIKYVDKKGSFCKSCGDDFIRLGLAEPLLDGCCDGSHAHHDETDDCCHSGAGSWTGLGLQARCSCACHHHNVTAATDSGHEKEVPETQ
jgi:hypothetical protein